MPREGGQPVRGYRPSFFGIPEEECEEAEIVRLSNLEVYAERASAGLPIFEEPKVRPPMKAKPGLASG